MDSGVARILIRGVLEVYYGRKAPEKFRPEAIPTNDDVIIAVSGRHNYIERESNCLLRSIDTFSGSASCQFVIFELDSTLNLI